MLPLFPDLEGIRPADKNQPLDIKWGSGETVSDLYDAFIDAGGNVVVCPHCAKAAGVKDLRKGAITGDKKNLSRIFIEADKILDY
jgi:hypothetical protein